MRQLLSLEVYLYAYHKKLLLCNRLPYHIISKLSTYNTNEFLLIKLLKSYTCTAYYLLFAVYKNMIQLKGKV